MGNSIGLSSSVVYCVAVHHTPRRSWWPNHLVSSGFSSSEAPYSVAASVYALALAATAAVEVAVCAITDPAKGKEPMPTVVAPGKVRRVLFMMVPQ